MATKTVEGFSLSHAAILDGTTGAEEVDGDIYGIRSGSMDVTSDSYDNTGDDAVLSSWFWFNYANVSVQAGYVPFETIAMLSGSTVTSSGAAPGDYYSIPLWNEKSLNQPAKPMLIRVPSKDSEGVSRTLDFVLFKVQFQPISFDGPSYKDGLLLNYAGRALPHNKDEKGVVLDEKAIGRLVSRPVA
jgi:hypothetical protein